MKISISDFAERLSKLTSFNSDLLPISSTVSNIGWERMKIVSTKANSYIDNVRKHAQLQSIKSVERKKAKRQIIYLRKIEEYFISINNEKFLIDWNTVNSTDFQEILSPSSPLLIENFDDETERHYFIQQVLKYIENKNKLCVTLAIIKFVNKIQCNVRAQLLRFKRNRREFFRKMNSFLFKNLDDYHALPLVFMTY